MKKLSFVIAVAFIASVVYLGSSSQKAFASSSNEIAGDTSKKEKKPVVNSGANQGSSATDSTKTEK